jgi:hypothetical protein
MSCHLIAEGLAWKGVQAMSSVVIFGNREWADLAHIYLSYDSPHDVVAFTLDRDHMRQKEHRGLPVVPFEDVTKEFPPDQYRIFIPISFANERLRAARKYERRKQMGYHSSVHQLQNYNMAGILLWERALLHSGRQYHSAILSPRTISS